MSGRAPSGRGTRAIDDHVDAADGGPPRHRYRPQAPHRFQGQGPLQEVTAHRVSGAPGAGPEHWHLVSYGLSELILKESDDPQVSGWGFELTFRIDGTEEPLWAVDFVTNMAAYVWTGGHPFEAGHLVDLGGPLRLETDSPITGAIVVADPDLAGLDGPFGMVEFLQIVGLTADELELCRSWRGSGVVDLLARDDRRLVTSLYRPSLLADPTLRAEAAVRAAADGSELTELRVATLQVRRRLGRGVLVQMGAGASAAFGPALRRELLGLGASFRIAGDDAELLVSVGEEAAWDSDGHHVRMAVPLDQVDRLADLFDGRPGWGRLPLWPDLSFRVVT